MQVGSVIADLTPLELLLDAIDRPGQLLAACLGGAA
jgi:hypothetical protein